MLETLGQYKILDRIGAGGMGEVYRARDTRLGRTVAIKLLPDDLTVDPERHERLLGDARAAAALSHPNIATLYEIGEDEGHVFLVFEFVPGESLKTVIAGRPLNPRRAVNLAIQIADALAEAHAEGIVHRDIRPDNIIVTPKGNAKILDFGLAAWTAGGAARENAVPDVALGSAAYMSPEQVLGQPVDARTDIFSLGIVLFEMLTGRLPFAGVTPAALGEQITQAAAPAPSAVNRSLPRELDPVVAKALAKNADDRYEAVTFAAELRAIAAILNERSEAAEPVTVAPTARRRQRMRTASIWALAVVFVPLALLVAWRTGVRGPIARAWRHALGPAPPPVIAVIPLGLGRADADPSQTFLADGLTEDLITRLGQTPGLKVIGRSATRAQRGRAPAEVAHELGASTVLTGTVQLQGDTIKLSLELVDPLDGVALWASEYSRDMKDIFAVQARIAEDVAQALRVKLRPTAVSARMAARLTDPQAYRAYLHGRQAAADSHLDEAIGFFDEAIAADPGLPEAFAGKAEALHVQVTFGDHQDDESRRQQLRTAADRAYQLDPDLPQANLAMSYGTESLAGSLKYLRHAIDADPSYTEGYRHIGDEIQDFDPERAIEFYRRSLELDPHLHMSRTHLASTLLALNRWEDARRELNPTQSSDEPDAATAVRAMIDVDERHFNRALDRLRAATGLRASPVLSAVHIVALRTAGQNDEAFQAATQMAAMFPRMSCESRGLVAGLRLEHGQKRPAHQLADPNLRAARSDSASPAAIRCGVATAAAMNDAPRAAALLTRIASREDLLRFWALEMQGGRGSLYLRGRMYPWTTVVDNPAVAAARERLDAAYKLTREGARKVLEGLPKQ